MILSRLYPKKGKPSIDDEVRWAFADLLWHTDTESHSYTYTTILYVAVIGRKECVSISNFLTSL